MPLFLVVLTMKILVAPHRVSSHFVWSFKVRLVLDLLQDLMYWLLEQRVHHLRSCRPRLPSKIPSGSVIVVMVRSEIPSILKDNLALSLALLLVLFNPLILINLIYELAYTNNRFPRQRLS